MKVQKTTKAPDTSVISKDLETSLGLLYTSLEESRGIVSAYSDKLSSVKIISSELQLNDTKSIIASSKKVNKDLDDKRLDGTRFIDSFKKSVMATVDEYKISTDLILSAQQACDMFARQEEEKRWLEFIRIEKEKERKILLEQIAIISKTSVQSYINDKIITLGRTYNTIIPSLTLADIDVRKGKLMALNYIFQPSDYEVARKFGLESLNVDGLENEFNEIQSKNILSLPDSIKLFAEKYSELKNAVMSNIDTRKQQLLDAEKNKAPIPEMNEASGGGLNAMIDMLSAEVAENNSSRDNELLTSELSADMQAQAQQQSVSGVVVKKKLKSFISIPRTVRTRTQTQNIFGMLAAFYLESADNDESKLDFLLSYYDKCKNSVSNPVDVPKIDGVLFTEEIKA